MSFLSWLNPHLQQRTTSTNVSFKEQTKKRARQLANGEENSTENSDSEGSEEEASEEEETVDGGEASGLDDLYEDEYATGQSRSTQNFQKRPNEEDQSNNGTGTSNTITTAEEGNEVHFLYTEGQGAPPPTNPKTPTQISL